MVTTHLYDCLHHLFEEQVAQTPDAVAVVFEDQQLTYRELNERANKIAHYLQADGVGPEVLVGICVERSLEMLVGLLGILKAGGAYVPLDPAYPPERLAFMLSDAQVSVLLTQTKVLASLPNHRAQVVCLDADWEAIARESDENPATRVTAETSAYVIYTSGSTGKPKGVVIQHGSLVNYIETVNVEYELTQRDRILQFSSISFDVSAEEIYTCLTVGATLVLRTDSMVESIQTFLQKCQDWEITVLSLPTAYWHELTAKLETLPPSLRLVIIGGEKALPARLAEWHKYVDQHVRLVNAYGPTEATISALMCDLSKLAAAQSPLQAVPIGRAIRNVQAYVLDRHLQLVPQGVVGELYLGGAGLGRGYLNHPELTALKFIPNPFSNEPGARLYKTGDLVRYPDDGNIEFLGRLDDQIKIRGFRIELGEIESVLNSHPAVQQAVVIDREEVPGQKRLIAYLVVCQPKNDGWRQGVGSREWGAYYEQNFSSTRKNVFDRPLVPKQELSAKSIRAYLSSHLPDYMVPAAFVTISALPLTANGKIDRLALPTPSSSRNQLEEDFIAPRTPVEEVVAGIWAEVLGLARVSVSDNFLELGGHSLLAIQIISRVRDIFQVELSLRSLFEAPTVAQLAQHLETARRSDPSLHPPITPVSLVQELPLSFAQEQLWLLYQLNPDTPVYNEPSTIRLTGWIDVTALEQSLNEVIRRHEVLRTTFSTVNGQPVQVIHPAATLKLSIVDLQALPPLERETEALRIATLSARKPFDLTFGPLLRATLIRLSEVDYRLFLTQHHIIDDAISAYNVLLPEIETLYKAFCAGKPSPLSELPIQYSDFAVWQRQWLQGEVLERHLAYWQQQLANLPVLQLPTDRPRPAVQTFQGARECIALSKTLTSALKTLSRQQGVTLFTTLLAAFKTLLYRYTGQDEIVIGTVTAGRNRPELENLLGFFLNTLVLRTHLSGNPSFGQLLKRVEEVALAAYAHEELPFKHLVDILQPERNLSHNPLFQVAFVLEPSQPPLDSGWTLSQLDVDTGTAKFDLSVELEEKPDGIIGKFEYNTDLFDTATIIRMIGHFQTMLESIVANPNQRLSNIPLLTDAERHQLLVEWNNIQTEYPKDKCIHQLFEEQVELSPDAIALVFEDEQLTYGELNRQANKIAHYLQQLGVGPEVLVGICVERSVEMVVGILGILKAGGAYVPLDPNYPQERLSFMLTDAQVSVVLTQQKLALDLPLKAKHVICLDTDWVAINLESQQNPVAGTKIDNLAYVMYTSGSTGRPKGVSVIHRGVVRLVKQTNYASFSSQFVFLQLAPTSFDASTFEIWGSLLNGARLVLFPGKTPSMQELGIVIQQHQITTLWLTAGLFHLMVDEQLSALQPLRQLLAGGDVLSVPHVRKLFQKLKNCTLINGYGPTENTTFTCCFPMTAASLIGDSVPIGRPIANTQTYILDDHLQPVPIGVRGELYVGGAGLAREYLNRPELTAERFIANPFVEGERLYKTGDLARYGSDGNIEFIGRIDHQVKIRGFRIELGEIEAVLNTHPQIQQAVVIATEDIPGNKRACAYVVPSNQSLTTNQLREFLKQKLPEYMVPAAFVTLDTLPLTPNGKVDRKALPTPDKEINREHEYVAPRTAIEEILTNIWQELLLKEKVSIHDNFFEIGGDSILSIQVVSRAKNSGVQITPKQIFQNQTIAELAKVANTTVSVSAQQGIVTGVAPLTPIQHWFFAQNPEEPHHYNQSVLLQIPNDLQSELIETALKKLIEHHDALRLRFTSVASEHKQIYYGKDDRVSFAIVDLSSTPRLEQPQALEKIATVYQASLNLSTGPIMQVVRFNLGSESDARLLIIIHHLAVDGVSWRILLSDLVTIYQQLIGQKPIKLNVKTTAFIDWADKLNNYAQSEIVKQELDYWLKQPWSKTTALPLDYAHIQQENTVGSAVAVSVKLSVEETHTLLLSVNEAYNTQINDILLSALGQTLAEWTGNSTVLIDLEGHGREELLTEVDLSRTVGWFTSLFPVLLELPTINQPASVIKSIKEQLRAIPNRGIGYGILRYLCEEPTVNEQLQTIPTSEISFNYLGQFDQVQSETGWKFAPEFTGYNQSSKQTRDHLLDINALVVEGELQIDWTYSSHAHTHATVEKLAQSYLQAIRSIIEHCQSEENIGYTPSDFPDARLNQLELDELLAPLKTKNIESIYPLSPMQQGMLFHSLYAPLSGVYFEQVTLSLQGNVNVPAFESTWQKVVDRYSILRTLFVWKNRKSPLQVVLKQVNLPWNNLDWLSLSTTEQQQQLSELLQTEREQGFQFNQAPLMRCTLIQLTDDTYKFIWSFHHVLLDGWCLPIIFKDVLSFYEAELTGETCPKPAPPPYRDYIAWLNSQDKEAASEFWRQTLHGFSAPTPLRVNKKSVQNQQQDSNYFELELRLSAEVSRELQSVARQHHVTLSTILQAAWALLLSHYSGETDVVFGVTVSGRPPSLAGVENMVGLLINTLPLRLLISPQEQLIPWLGQIQQLMLELQHYSYTPLVDIQALSDVPGGIPLFESIVVFENYPVDSSLFNEGGSLQLSEIESFEKTNYPLTVVAVPGDELLVKISYDIVRFEEDTIRRMLGHLQTIFSGIVENPVAAVGELPLLSEAERHQLLREWNDTPSEYPTDKCIHQLFEAQVEKTPLSVAVVFENQQLTYFQLNQRANQLAHHLLSLGVGPEVLVGICVERSVEMVVGLLGILKAGGAYVPLDPNYPQERLSYMLADSCVEVLLTQQSLLESLPQNQARVVCLDTDWGGIDQHSQENLDAGVGSDNLAYVIYTSGSTGQPKGVAIEHHSLCNLAIAQRNLFDVEPTSRVLQFASVSFDASVSEIFMAVTTGAMLILATASELMPGDDLKQILHKFRVTHVTLPPSALAVLPTDELPALGQIIVAGEACPLELINQWSVGRRFFNAYGPTESTVCATVAQISDSSDKITIGGPISNTQIYILDKHLQPVPIGVPGELHIGGALLARGYLNRPELTSEKFIPNPFSDSKSERLYKTGDLARHLSDGNIEYLGRIDNQVKIRGFRIELGEIEAVVSQHPHVQQVVVIIRSDILGDKYLAAYVVPAQTLTSTRSQESGVRNQESAPTIADLRHFLKQKLPDYMIPSVYVMLDALPLTPNGKVDRRALPAPEGFRLDLEAEYVAPRTLVEEMLAKIWTEVLGLEKFGIHDNFFNLGGHSLKATQVLSRVQEAFQLELPLHSLFEEPTIAKLSQVIEKTKHSDAVQASVIKPVSREKHRFRRNASNSGVAE